MQPFWSGPVATFLETPPAAVIGTLAEAQKRHFRTNEVQHLRAWEASLALLRAALAVQPECEGWFLLLEFPMLRLGRRADALLLTPRAILVLEFKIGATHFTPADRAQVEDYAIDLFDFHAGSRRHPIIPIIVATHAAPRLATRTLPCAAVWTVIEASAATLPGLLHELARATPEPAKNLDPRAWCAAPYRPVPGIVEAACMLYARHGVADIRAARADAENLSVTTDAIIAAIAHARGAGERLILFVTGIPGAGKTLCGLNAAFGLEQEARATFLTGNPTLVHVLREALARDAVFSRGADGRAARQQTEGAIQALPRFRDHYVGLPGEVPAERIVVIDEAQRCWSAAHAIAKTRDRPVRLENSEPAHLLEIMSRHKKFAAMICLVGGGQEIHDGEGNLAEWGRSLRAVAGWRVVCAPDLLQGADPRTRLGALGDLRVLPQLHLRTSMRQIRFSGASAWVDHVLAGDAAAAAAVAEQSDGALPYFLTRSLAAARAWLRAASRGHRSIGLLASSGARRLRAEGLGAELPHMDAQAVAHWFLDRFPDDVRAANALEVVATEFSCQGLELDFVGLCWDADLIREPGRAAWRARNFRGKDWTHPSGAEAIANQLNTYRVLLTRARFETVIFVPRGDAGDRTRDPMVLESISGFLSLCGARDLVEPAVPRLEPELLLL